MEPKMVPIMSCDLVDCAYNKHKSCHTLAITVGGPKDPCPSCDTYLPGPHRGGIPDIRAGVGACKVESCSHNSALECSASSINMIKHNGHPDCMTYKMR